MKIKGKVLHWIGHTPDIITNAEIELSPIELASQLISGEVEQVYYEHCHRLPPKPQPEVPSELEIKYAVSDTREARKINEILKYLREKGV